MDQLGLGAVGVALSRDQFGVGKLAEELGYETLWIAGGQLDALEPIADLVARTTRASVAPAIIQAGVHSADSVADLYRRLETDAPGRFVAGLGGPQTPRSLSAFGAWLDDLDDLGVPQERRLIAALGPRKLELARDRSAGAITLLTTPEFTATARATLGPDSTLVADLFVVLDDDPDRTRTAARGPLGFLSGVGGYRANFTRMGFTDEDIDTLSDRLVDALVPWGDVAAIEHAVATHREAGADHVVLSPLPTPVSDDPADTLRALASAIIDG